MLLGRFALASALLTCACAHEPAAPAQDQGFSQWLSQARGPIPAQRTDAARWKPAPSPLMTRWGRAVRPDDVWSEHPRPQFARATWASLNGLWEFAEAHEDEAPPCGQSLAEQILVPFPMESALSGIGRHHERAWYRRTFMVPPSWRQGRVLLHFEAVDWRCSAWLNGQELGTHEGGYDSFSFDVTDALGADGLQELVVAVFDPTESGDQPRGKQTTKPQGIWYTPSSGIWQTVWLEPVPTTRIGSIAMTTSVERGELALHVDTEEGGAALDLTIFAGGQTILTQAITPGVEARIAIPDAHAWSPADPFLYDLCASICA
jgi:beta-galactosidase/beta-glucuronidase